MLLGPVDEIRRSIADQRLDDLDGVTIIDPMTSETFSRYVARYWELRRRRGVTFEEGQRRMRMRNYYAAVMLEQGAVDGLVTGLTSGYAASIRPSLEVVRTRPGQRAAGVYIVVTKNDFKFFADCTVNVDPPPRSSPRSRSPRATSPATSTSCRGWRCFRTRPSAPPRAEPAQDGDREGPRPAAPPGLEVDGEIQVDIATNAEVRVGSSRSRR